MFIFNPEHELALANNDENFMPKASTKKLAEDLRFLSFWCEQTDKISVWGWNKYIRKKLILSGIDKNILPSDEYLQNIRELSHRKTASEAMFFLRREIATPLPYPAEILKNITEIEHFAQKYYEIVLKSPYSSSGKGVYFSGKDLSNSVLGWCKKTVTQQGCVLGEKRFEVVKNFAMEFQVVDNQTNFVGYSLFETDGKIYRNNILTSDENIEKTISRCGIDLRVLNAVKQSLIKFFNQKIAQKYSGFLGVDMFVFQENGKKFLNPCVEINLRHTMGLVAHKFYKNFVLPNSEGIFSIDFYENSTELFQNHKQNFIDKPLIIKDNKIVNGYLSLCPVFENTNYRVRVEI